jgi:CelD/BcsL family acetyltransferase involved in cellulose biosynthesis
VSLQVDRLASIDALPGLRAQWEQIAADMVPRTPFTTPLWNELWWRHLRRAGMVQRDELCLLVVRAGGRLLAVAPLMITHAPAYGPWRTRRLHYLGADSNITEMHGLVCRAEDEQCVVSELSGHFTRLIGSVDWIRWSGIHRGGAAHRWLDGQGRTQWEAPVFDYWIRMPSTWEEFRSGQHRNIKESLRKCYNSLKRAGYSCRLLVIDDPAQTRAAIERFRELHSARALQTIGMAAQAPVRHPDHFVRQATRDFLHEYCGALAARGELRIFQLEIGGVIVATRIGFLLGRELYLYYSGYLPEWGRYSVMTTLLAEAFKWAIAQRLAVVNLSTGRDNSKLRWSPEESAFMQGVQQGDRLRNRLAFRAYTWAKSGQA